MNSAAKLFHLILVISLMILTPPLSARGADEGIEYFTVNPPMPTGNKDKVEVLEAFSYGCPHCYQFEPILKSWKKSLPSNVEFVRFHVIFGGRSDWAIMARAYYTAEVLGVVEKIHHPMFEAIHDKKRDLSSDEKMAVFFAEHGVKKQDFLDAYHSFAVDNKVRRAADLTERYKVDGVPSMIVNGKYRTSARYTGGNDGLLKVIDELIAKESKK